MLKKYKYHLIILVVIVIIAYFILKRNRNTGTIKQEKPNKLPGTTPSSQPTVTDAFPLKIGSRGANVTKLQAALNRITPSNKIAEDGIFGNQTYGKLITSVNSSSYPVTQTIFNQIINK